ncbi:MAG: hypothetical protein E6G84_13385 [Alphaproteobacteria bacterium]|nr:MAG: hypothetical protein E6G84_13385 [Alphaproteobacteria bacterium]
MLLLGSQDTLDGLRAGSLRLARRSFNFSILEASTSRVYKWKPALGVHKFAIRDAKAVATFKPGFEIPAGGDTQWAAGGAITPAAARMEPSKNGAQSGTRNSRRDAGSNPHLHFIETEI